MKKDKRTKAQLLKVIEQLGVEINVLKEDLTIAKSDDICRADNEREQRLRFERDKYYDEHKLFKDSLKFILRNVKH